MKHAYFRKVLASAALMLGLGLSSSAFAKGYGAAGCGLGSIVFGAKPGIFQILAATTNPTSGSQTFGITTGTSNCDGAILGSVGQKKEFIVNNMNTLSKEAAQGGGETVLALSRSFGCSDAAYGAFAGALKDNHSEVFMGRDAEAILSATTGLVGSNAVLNSNCRQG